MELNNSLIKSLKLIKKQVKMNKNKVKINQICHNWEPYNLKVNHKVNKILVRMVKMN